VSLPPICLQHETYQVKLNEQLQDIIQIDTTMQLPNYRQKPAKLDSINLPWPENQRNFEMYIDDLGSAQPPWIAQITKKPGKYGHQ
jgi:hypothetical protein